MESLRRVLEERGSLLYSVASGIMNDIKFEKAELRAVRMVEQVPDTELRKRITSMLELGDSAGLELFEAQLRLMRLAS